jgi:tellurite resistance protein TerC
MPAESIGSPILWAGFTLFVAAMLALDLGVLHREAREVRFKEALTWSCVWVALALLFNAGVWTWFGAEKGLEFTTGYLIEKALSVDNIFVFLVVFSYFRVPKEHQHRVLFWGILGALVMRAIFIFAGAALLQAFHWVIYIFGGLLIVTGARMLFQRDHTIEPDKNPMLKIFKRFVPMVHEYDGPSFWVTRDAKRYATPLLAVLVVVEATDLVFAVDSIPAVFAVTKDPFIVYTSNIFAILGLRAMYFLLAGVMDRFRYLKTGLALVLVFVGIKMCVVEIYHVPIGVSLGIVAGILLASVLASLAASRPESK